MLYMVWEESDWMEGALSSTVCAGGSSSDKSNSHIELIAMDEGEWRVYFWGSDEIRNNRSIIMATGNARAIRHISAQ